MKRYIVLDIILGKPKTGSLDEHRIIFSDGYEALVPTELFNRICHPTLETVHDRLDVLMNDFDWGGVQDLSWKVPEEPK